MKKVRKNLRELTTELQTLCHEGYSNCEVCIKVHDGFYRVGKISRAVVHGETNRDVFTIEAEVCK